MNKNYIIIIFAVISLIFVIIYNGYDNPEQHTSVKFNTNTKNYTEEKVFVINITHKEFSYDTLEKLKLIKSTTNYTENIPEKGYFITTVTVKDFTRLNKIASKPPTFNYVFSTDKEIEIELPERYNEEKTYLIYGYKDDKNVIIYDEEEII